MCILNEQQIRQVYLRCNCIPLQKLVELCMNPTSGITKEGLQKAGYHKIDQLTELCHRQEEIERSQSESVFSETLDKDWESIMQMFDNAEKIECINKFIERLYLYDITVARKYREMAERLMEELNERVHPIVGMIDTMRFEWTEAVESNTIQGYNRFIDRYPDSEYQEEAKKRIQCIEKLLRDIKRVPSDYSRERMYEIISSNRLSREDLVYNHHVLTDRAYEHIRRYPHLEDEQRELPFSRIEKPYSEHGNIDVYFFGLSGSGKTCLLAGLMGLSGQLGFQFDPRGPGGAGNFASELRNYSRCSMLPPHDCKNYIQIIDAQINDENGNPHDISLIEMSGEKLRDLAMMENSSCIDDLGIGASALLLNDNKKILFFVIDPSNEGPMVWNDYGNSKIIKQSDAIQSVLSILQKNKKVMRKIEAIHFILTKCDSLGEDIDQDVIRDRIIRQGYMDCIQFAKSVCQEFDINRQVGNSVGLYPFSLGKFMPGDTYTYDDTRALMILRGIQKSLPIEPKSLWPSGLIKWFNS